MRKVFLGILGAWVFGTAHLFAQPSLTSDLKKVPEAKDPPALIVGPTLPGTPIVEEADDSRVQAQPPASVIILERPAENIDPARTSITLVSTVRQPWLGNHCFHDHARRTSELVVVDLAHE